MTEIDLPEFEKRVLIFLHLTNDANFFPDINIMSRVFGISGYEMEKTVLKLQDAGYIDKRRHYSDKTPDTGGYRAYIEDTSAQQPAVDEASSPSGGSQTPESESSPQSDTQERPTGE